MEQTGRSMIVETPSGPVQGMLVQTPDGLARSFRGVPFAEVTERFRLAQAVSPRRKICTATLPAPPAPQPAGGSVIGSERDCLTVNIWTPHAIEKPLPVLVWIHGGLHVMGSHNDPLCDGARFAARTGTVVVAVNHRLGALGFLTLDHLLGDDYRDSANLALHDVLAALEWVRTHVGAFGGDPSAVTLGGQSAGATMTAMLLAAQRARGLFHRAILQSASPERMGDRAYGEMVTDDLLGVLGLRASPRRVLDVPWQHIVAAQNELMARHLGDEGKGMAMFRAAVFRPALDGRLLTQSPMEAVRAGASADVDLIVGTNVNEASRAVDLLGGDNERLQALVEQQMPTLLPQWPTSHSTESEDGATGCSDSRSAAYRNALASVLGHTPTDAESAESCLTDERYRQPSQRLLDARSNALASTRAFLFAWRATASLGATHSCELPFLFRTLNSAEAVAEVGPEAPSELSDTMSARWSEFIAGRKPTGWPEYSSTHRSTLVLAEKTHVEQAPREAIRRLVEAAQPAR
ncbi:carboxylesterase/lipase family protein [Rathayibacter toxicus]|nr:carboxylesterase/lipase family protein [Rathayibacter toxicus]QWL35341.1 carboxylesterase/lipase family protein [Rathayibacter toxicus]QWL37472.1 carboxylesterase/lipase family protein [Rathayibacter toxicus]QWL39565.1 carboxylesterase/lipase family protein [Rathayibacter toxicus]QWL41648.1 carboxylesterase/lipase family protein [Rathayibacter toxicus]